MKNKYVLTVLGGGSVWTPQLLKKLAEPPLDYILEIRLQGPTESHLHQIAAFSQSFGNKHLNIKTIPDMKDAVSGARIILNQARIGGWAARLDDEMLPVQLGAVGDESLGLGGLRAAIRSLPFVVNVSRVIRQEAPDAWLLNLSNPCDLLGRAFRWAGLNKVVGLCDHPQMLAHEMAYLAGSPEKYTRFSFIGMNHVGWLQPPPKMDLTALISKRPEFKTWLREWGSLPTPWRMHLLKPDMLIQKQQSAPGLRARKLMRLNEKLRRSIDQQDVEKYNALLSLRSPTWYTEVVVPAIRGIVGKEPVRLVAGLPNDGRMLNFDRQVQIECWAGLHSDEIFPEPLPNSQRCQEDLTEFGRTRALAFEALCSGKSGALSRYVDADPFARPVLAHNDWQKRLGFNAMLIA